MIKVRVRNVQSISDAELEIDGFTVLTGPNNSGKSALVRAIRGVFKNSPPRSLVRRGEKHLTVDMEFDDGQKVTWRKGKGITEYEVNGGDPLGSVGRACPEEVRDLGIAPIVAGGQEVWPQIAPQFDGTLFLTNLPGSVLAEAIADVERVGTLNRALKLADKDRRSAASTLKVRRVDLLDIESELSVFDSLDDLGSTVEELEKLDARKGKIESVSAWVQDRWGQIQKTQESLDSLSGCNITLPEDPEVGPLLDSYTQTASDLEEARRTLKAIEDLQEQIPVLDAVISNPEFVALSKLDAKIEKLNKFSESISAVEEKLPEFNRLRQLLSEDLDVELPDTDDAEMEVIALEALETQVHHLNKVKSQVEKMVDQESCRRIELEAVEAEIETLLQELKICPTCSAPHQEGHHHAEDAA